MITSLTRVIDTRAENKNAADEASTLSGDVKEYTFIVDL